jgi:hypothetical protein
MAFLTVLMSFLAPIQALLLMMIGFIVIDTLLAIYATIKINGMASFKSNKLFNVVVKSFFYCSSIVMAFAIDKYIMSGTLFGIEMLLSKAMSVFWIYIEVKSIDETSINLGNRSFWVIIKEMIAKIGKLKTDIKKLNE